MGSLIRAMSQPGEDFGASAVSKIARAGLDAIDVSVDWDEQFTSGALVAEIRSAVEAAERQGLRLVSMTVRRTPAHVASEDTRARDAAFRSARAVVEAAGVLGASLCTFPPPAMVEGTLGYREALNGLHGLLGAVAETAAAAGVTVAVRAPSGGCLLSPVEVRELIDSAYSPEVGVCVDLEELRTVGRFDDWIETLRHRVVCVRGLSDAVDACVAALSETVESCVIINDS